MIPPSELSELRGWFDGVCDVYETQYDSVMDVSYARDDFFSDVGMLANMMAGNDGDIGQAAPDCAGLVFEFTCDSDGQIGGAEVQIRLASPGSGLYLSKWLEDKYMTDDRSASGPEGAWAVVTCLYDAFQKVKSSAEKIASLSSV